MPATSWHVMRLALALTIMLPVAPAAFADPTADPQGDWYRLASACWQNEACRAELGQACDAGDPVSCAAFGRATMEARPGVDQADAQAAFESACPRIPALCVEATSAWRDNTPRDTAARRRLLAAGCEADDFGSCVRLTAEWDSGPDANPAAALAAARRACSLNDWTCAGTLAMELLHSSNAAEWAEARSLLLRAIHAGDWDAARTLVAIRYGDPANLPEPLRAAWDDCRSHSRCSDLAGMLEARL